MTPQDRGSAYLAKALADPQTRAEVNAIVDEMAQRDRAYVEERAATLAEASNPAVIEEGRDWERTLSDGID